MLPFYCILKFRNQPILRFDVMLQHDWPIEQCLLHIRVFFDGENEEAMFWSFHPLAHKTSNEHLPRPFFKAIRKSLNVDKPKPGDNKQVFKFLNGLESKFMYG